MIDNIAIAYVSTLSLSLRRWQANICNTIMLNSKQIREGPQINDIIFVDILVDIFVGILFFSKALHFVKNNIPSGGPALNVLFAYCRGRLTRV